MPILDECVQNPKRKFSDAFPITILPNLINLLPDSLPHPAQLPIAALIQQCEVKRTRASGPGGQHRNKVETAIVITHTPSGIIGQASETRNQERNRKIAVHRLRVNLALGVRTDFTAPSPKWMERVKGRKISVSLEHQDFPSILCEALNCIFSADIDIAVAAKRLNVSTSQLIKLLKAEPSAFEWLNREREKRDLHRIR